MAIEKVLVLNVAAWGTSCVAEAQHAHERLGVQALGNGGKVGDITSSRARGRRGLAQQDDENRKSSTIKLALQEM